MTNSLAVLLEKLADINTAMAYTQLCLDNPLTTSPAHLAQKQMLLDEKAKLFKAFADSTPAAQALAVLNTVDCWDED